ncbi:MAG: phosphoglycolate phosphatase [Dokdonella sp.]
MSARLRPAAVLFDLDGTLVDSAPDLVAAVAVLCRELGAPPPDAQKVRSVVSAGGRSMLRAGLPQLDEAAIEVHLARFLAIYAENLGLHTRPYAGIAALLAELETRDIVWGIVTNKPGWLARPLLEQVTLGSRCAALVTGDCLPVRKPDPAPLLRACELAGVEVNRCVYVGDDLRDIEAGRAAGMPTVAAAWGYLNGSDPAKWGADLVVASPVDLLAALGLQ